MIPKINVPTIKNKPIFTGKGTIVKKGSELALQVVDKKPGKSLINKISIKFKMLKMRFQTPNSQNPIFDRPIKEEIRAVQTFGLDNEQPTRAIVLNHLWSTISPNHETLYSGRLSEYELKKLVKTLTIKEQTPVDVPPQPFRIGYSDSQSQKTRNKIREHLWDNLVPNYKQLHSGRLSEFEMKKLISNLTKPPKVDHEKFLGLRINNLEQVQENAYRGQSLAEKPQYLFNLKDAGIRTVIDLAGHGIYKNSCENAGLEYKTFFTDTDFWINPAFKSKESYVSELNSLYKGFYSEEEIAQNQESFVHQYHTECRKFIDKFVDYIETINKGNFYIGCSFGTYRTDDALIFDQYFNPSCAQSKKLNSRYSFSKRCMTQLYKNLSERDKNRLGFTPEFEENLRKKLDIK